MKHLSIILIILSFSVASQAQKKAMSPEVYKTWKRIGSRTISDNGNTLIYTTTCETCDPRLHIHNTIKKTTHSFDRATNAKLTTDGNYVVFVSKASRDTVRSLKLKKTKKNDMPNDTLIIYNVSKKSTTVVPNIDKFKLSESQNYIALTTKEHSVKEDTTEVEIPAYFLAKNLNQVEFDTLGKTKTFYINDHFPYLVYETLDEKDKANGIQFYNYEEQYHFGAHEGKIELKGAAFSKNEDYYALVINTDTTDEKFPLHDLWYGTPKGEVSKLNSEAIPGANGDLAITSDRLRFSEAGDRIYFAHKVRPFVKDTNLLDDEIVNVEVWNYQDQMLYTQQENNLNSDKNKAYGMLLNLSSGDVKRLDELDRSYTIFNTKENQHYGLEINSKPYSKYISWKGYSYSDVYLVDLQNGEKQKIVSEKPVSVRLSSGGNYSYWFDREQGSYTFYDNNKKKITSVITNSDIAILNELNDVPQHPWSYGVAGWTSNDQYIYLYDRYDIWKVDPSGKTSPQRLTKGRRDKVVYRMINLYEDDIYLDRNKAQLITAFNEKTKGETYNFLSPDNTLQLVKMDEVYSLGNPTKAKDADKIFFTVESYQKFPDLHIMDLNSKNIYQVSNANPQQKEYLWGQIELVKWTNGKGEELEGLLVKPENFDSNRKYPLLVNFYERSSDRLHRHRAPYANRSTINYNYYASKGYVIFNPDVTYEVGYPGRSAEEDVLSGIDHIVEKGYIDQSRIGVQGHSWGGYQVAHLLTKTDVFACAESGAPVVNMVSAYGGIRWGSGMSRMFQYERTQSRLGGSLWESPDLYLENSPIFNMDKVNTPVLILHNDEDGAVPWYQGIEYFVAMRRLGKPAWLLNYNGEPHWPVKWENRLDFNIRMEQFFDHYLMGEPMPKWMKRGVPALEKGINQGLD